MAKKSEMRQECLEIVEAMDLNGVDVPAEDELKSREWADLLSDLKAKQRDAECDTVADAAEAAEGEAEAAEGEAEAAEGEASETSEPVETKTPAPKKSYVVASGKALITRRGMRKEGMPVTAGELSGGVKDLEHFAKVGVLDEVE